MAYVYLILTLSYALLWSVFFILRKDLRKKILLSSILAAPLGMSEMLFIPAYWIPHFQVIPLLEEVFLESILFCFFLGGVVAVLYQVLFNADKFEFPRINPWLTLIAPVLFLFYLLNPFKVNVMCYVIISMIIGGSVILFCSREKAKPILYSAILNMMVYSLIYFSLWYLFPELPASYQFQNLSGILLGGIPVEEFLWIFSFSLYWTPLYEIWRRYLKEKSTLF